MKIKLPILLLFCFVTTSFAQAPDRRQFIRVEIEQVEIVFKDGVGYDSEQLIQSVQGLAGVRCDIFKKPHYF